LSHKSPSYYLSAIIAHITKWRKIGRKTPSLATQHAKIANSARRNYKLGTRRLEFHHAEFTENTRQKVCKNVHKWAFLQSGVANPALPPEKHILQPPQYQREAF